VAVQTPDGLIAQLEGLRSSLAKSQRIIVEIDGPGNECVYFGVGGRYSFVSSTDHPYLTTMGDRSARGSVDYYYQGHHSPIERHHLIPWSRAKSVVREFCATGKLSDDAIWEPA
jgi:hypothetical protein